ncbi:MAG: sulfotransferase [Candidatus Parabeggiatoa sp.]|nr:sulfotransferase [Candidatus Parabeggiatoa sp.]
MKYCFVFVCQQGQLEIKSMLLAASLKRYLRCDYELVAAIPQPASRWGTLSEDTQTLMQILGIRSVPITNEIDENYPIGNKVACLGIETSAEKIVFLDSDILCLREFSPQFAAPFSAKPADLNLFLADPSIWQQVYDLFELPLPLQRVVASTSGELMLPYFNAGVIAVQNDIGFKAVWEECCQVIDAADSIKNKRPWLDQIALPVAVARLKLEYQCLDERFNYPVHHKPLLKSPLTPIPQRKRQAYFSKSQIAQFLQRKPVVEKEELPFLSHYHWPSVIRREPVLNKLVMELAETYSLLKKLILNSTEWAPLLTPYTLSLPRRRLFLRSTLSKPQSFLQANQPEAIITGIPRSGTSYLCRLLHSVQDCVVINEPSAIFTPLANELPPWQIAIYYQTLRRDILDGQPVENKVHNGQIIEDTAAIDVRSHYHPQISRPDFLLATKNTLSYLARIPQLKEVLPHATMIACVRHPLDTIASWKSSFPHLKHAIVTQFTVGHVNDPFLPQWQRHRLAEIAATDEDFLKRALLWRYLAECLLTYAHSMTLIHYEELVRQPTKALKTILQQIPNAPPFYCSEKITPSVIRQKRKILEVDDIQAIGDICNQHAIALGYHI